MLSNYISNTWNCDDGIARKDRENEIERTTENNYNTSSVMLAMELEENVVRMKYRKLAQRNYSSYFERYAIGNS